MDHYKLRFVPLGGVVGVTKNMYLYELYKNDELQDILIVDCGIGFPQEQDLGVDFVIPDISYLRDKLDKIRGICLTHGHEDHITALPYHYEALGRPPVFGSKLTVAFVVNKAKEFYLQMETREIDYNRWYQFGGIQVQYIHTTHSIPDTCHLLIRSPIGTLYHGSDFKLDLNPPFGNPPDFYAMTKAGKEGILALMSDCLGSERDGLTLSESVVGQTFEDEMRKTKGKFIMTTFSSNISRIRQCVDAAIKFNRKIIFMGRSMRDNTKMASEMNYLPVPLELMGKEEDVMRLPPKKICLIVAGSQGQYQSALSKITRKQHRFIKINPGDKVVFSSDPIPGNEEGVTSIIEELTLQGADVVYPAIQDQLHTSGHGNKLDMMFLMRFTNPKYFVPIGGTIRHQRQYQRLCEELGYKKDNVFLLNEGDTVWFSKGSASKGDTVFTKNIYVDSTGVGEVGTMVLKDRQTLSSEGIVVAVLPVDQQNKLVGRPRILSRGFVFEKNEERLFEDATRLVEKVTRPQHDQIMDYQTLRKRTSDALEEFFQRERNKNPMVIVELLQV
ncbi:MAG: ribonuclease J [Patescibacteria group bacterium]|nr:ribonuclease J [Patescibacteria group bacterium]